MWDKHVGLISTDWNCVAYESQDNCPIHSCIYRAGSKARDSERSKIDNVVAINVMHPEKTKRVSPDVFTRNKNGAIRFYDEQRYLYAVKVPDSCRLP